MNKKLSQNTGCHSERSEESIISVTQTGSTELTEVLRFAQGDGFEILSK